MGARSPDPEAGADAAQEGGKWRYPGAHSFEDTALDHALFFGRRREIDDLVHQVRASSLMVLYGKSGLGKTSLLNAGVFPALRAHHLLPLRVRVNETALPLVDAIYAQIEHLCREQGIEYTEGNKRCLWEYFKTAVFWRGRTLLTPVLVLDQFEEIFTLQDRSRRQALAAALGELVSGGLPRSVRQRMSEDEALDYSEKPPSLKLVISLRWEYVGRLEELFLQIPSILTHRFLLQPLRQEQAGLAIVEPARQTGDEFITRSFQYEDDAITELLGFLSASDGAIEPYQLQLLCQHVERQVAQRQGASQVITVDHSYLGGKAAMESILGRFYLDTIAGLKRRKARGAARDLCEWGLLSQDGHRIDMPGKRILEDYALSETDLGQLVDKRLLRREPKFSGYSYELAHDSLAEPIRKLRRYKLPKKVLAGMGGAAVVVVLIVLGLSLFARVQKTNALEAQTLALQAQLEEARRTDVTQEVVQAQLAENQRLQAALEKATDQIHELIDKNEKIALTLSDARAGAEVRTQAAAKLTAQVASTRSTLQTARIIDKTGKVTAPVRTGGVSEPELVEIHAGGFLMGSNPRRIPDAQPDEFPQRRVSIKRSFLMGRYEVTFQEYDLFALATGRELPDDRGWGRGRRPVINVSWKDAVAYAEWLSKQTGKRYRLPTEAEWEFAARAGTTTSYWWGDEVVENRANCRGCGSQWGGEQTAPAGSFKPNPFGLYDTAGNVWEWVQDCWHDSYKGAPGDGSAWEEEGCGQRVMRGGSWGNGPEDVRSAGRSRNYPDSRSIHVGFRLAQDIK
jgi:formylglycine-generating enzyme required for sulfatase activity